MLDKSKGRVQVKVEYILKEPENAKFLQWVAGGRKIEMSAGTFDAFKKLLDHLDLSESVDSYYERSQLIDEHRQVFLNNENLELSKHVICGEIHKYLTRYMSPKKDNCDKASNEKDLLKIIHFCLIEIERINQK